MLAQVNDPALLEKMLIGIRVLLDPEDPEENQINSVAANFSALNGWTYVEKLQGHSNKEVVRYADMLFDLFNEDKEHATQELNVYADAEVYRQHYA